MSIAEGAEAICAAITAALEKGQGLLIGRNGTIELEVVLTKEPTFFMKHALEHNAGVWPTSNESLDDWREGLRRALTQADILALGWYAPLADEEKKLMASLHPNLVAVPLRSIEPYYVPPELRWTKCLAGQKVAVVSSFTKTIQKQLQKREDIWPLETDSLLPPDTEWIPIQTGYSPSLAKGSGEWPLACRGSWKDAVEYVVSEVMASQARIALIGCGGLGMLIASELKAKGIICIVMGGAIQVLFGIKGNRWKTHSVISHFWNDDWAWPSKEETPRGAQEVERACYWS